MRPNKIDLDAALQWKGDKSNTDKHKPHTAKVSFLARIYTSS